MKYRIDIVKIEKEDYEKKEYEKIADTGNPQDGRSVYGYVGSPDVRNIETNVLSQEVETLDLTKVIKAINGIE